MEEMNGDLRKKMDITNGDLRKISVYTSGDSGYNINKEVTFIWKDMYLNVKFIMKYLLVNRFFGLYMLLGRFR